MTQATLVLKRVVKPPAHSPLFSTLRRAVLEEANVLRHLRRVCEPYLLCFENFYEDDQFWYIATELLGSYVTLLQFETRRPKLPTYDILLLMDRLIRGLRQMHAARVAHRDIKPDNIMVEEKTLNIKYIDFGWACFAINCITSLVLGGNADYMAPEILRPDPDTLPFDQFAFQKGDIWSLGITLYELLTGNGITTDFVLARGVGSWLDLYRLKAPHHFKALQTMLLIDPNERRLPNEAEEENLARETDSFVS